MSRTALAELRYRVHVHHRDQGAVLAVHHSEQHGVGVARYRRHPHDNTSAAVAIALADDWRDRGLETELLSRLAVLARSRGIQRLTVLREEASRGNSGRIVR